MFTQKRMRESKARIKLSLMLLQMPATYTTYNVTWTTSWNQVVRLIQPYDLIPGSYEYLVQPSMFPANMVFVFLLDRLSETAGCLFL